MWYVTIAVLLAETTFYLIFASGEEQSWNKKVIVEKWYKSKCGVRTTFAALQHKFSLFVEFQNLVVKE